MDQPAELPEESRQFALQRFRLLQPHLEQHRALRLVAAEAKIPFRTAQRWVALYQKFGLAALARKKRADRGNQRTVSIKLKEAIEGLGLQRPPMPIAAIRRQVLQLAKKLGEEPPGYSVVYRIVRGLPDDLCQQLPVPVVNLVVPTKVTVADVTPTNKSAIVSAFGRLYDNIFLRIKGTTSRHLLKRSHRRLRDRAAADFSRICRCARWSIELLTARMSARNQIAVSRIS